MACALSEDARAQPRPSLLGRGQAPLGPPPTPSAYPAMLCDYGHAYWAASAYGTGKGDPCLIPSRFSATVAIATKSPL